MKEIIQALSQKVTTIGGMGEGTGERGIKGGETDRDSETERATYWRAEGGG